MDGGFTCEVRARLRWGDVAALLVVPAVLVSLFLLPRATRLGLAFRPADPSLLTAFTAHYVHLNATHLLANLLGYALLAPLVYLLSLLSGHRRLFYTGLTTFLLAFPLVLSGLELALGQQRLLLGFSGINAALFGLLAFTLSRYVGVRFADRIHPGDAPPAFFLAIAVVAAIAVPPSFQSVGIAVAALLSGLLYVESVLGHVSLPSVDGLRSAAAQSGYFELAGAGIGLFVAYPFLAFPSDAVLTDAVVNLYAHLLGFALAFLAVYLVTVLTHGADRGATYIN
jgi:hypothetical protein